MSEGELRKARVSPWSKTTRVYALQDTLLETFLQQARPTILPPLGPDALAQCASALL
jgi:hypothetical protein